MTAAIPALAAGGEAGPEAPSGRRGGVARVPARPVLACVLRRGGGRVLWRAPVSAEAMSLAVWRRKLWEMGLRRCGLNADWSVEAWHVDRGTPNDRGGDIYLIEDDDGTWALVQRWYAIDAYAPLSEEEQAEMGVDGLNDAIEEVLVLEPGWPALALVRDLRVRLEDTAWLSRRGFLRWDGDQCSRRGMCPPPTESR